MTLFFQKTLACLSFCWLTATFSLLCADDAQHPEIFAHYMPWYSSQPVSGKWGWHWTMDHFDPEKIRPDGRREIASHDYPLVGPYDSGDRHLLEYHVLLMKYSGIDGVIIDWYGMEDFYDYRKIHQNTQRLIPFLKKAGLQFAICYEDQSVGQMVQSKETHRRGVCCSRKRGDEMAF